MRRRLPLFLLVLAALGLLGTKRPAGLGDVVEVRHWSYRDYTRVVVEFTRPVTVEGPVQHLRADGRARRPERLYLDLNGLWVGRRYLEAITVRDGLLRGIRLGQYTLKTTRLVLDLERYDRYRLIELTHPHRVVVDVYGERGRGETLRWPERRENGRPGYGRLPMPIRPLRTVVIDPGHGGRDPGAIGVGGLREKDVTLRLAKALAPRLVARGFEVVSTRDGDRTISLEERTAIAESVRGDLLLSLHANAARRRSVRGIETYYLDENHERHTLTVAARENGITRSQVNELQETVAKLRVSEASDHSERVATMVQDRLVRGLPRRYRPVPDLGVKKGPFYVLFLANMPAILVEAGFLTNRQEARRLRDREYIEALAEQIAEGVARYRDATDLDSPRQVRGSGERADRTAAPRPLSSDRSGLAARSRR